VHKSLSQAIQHLAAHPKRDRIHKLLYWVCKGQWENSTAKLDRAPIDVLLQELVQNASTLEILERRIYKAASVLNKSETYTRIALVIVQSCTDYYASISTHVDPENDSEDLFELLTGLALEDETTPIAAITAPDRFEIRRLLMQQMPPLKIKILLFSVLRHPFAFEPIDWAELKAKTLDEWVEELLQSFPSIERLEPQLLEQAATLTTLDQSNQVAHVIVQTLRLKTR
jgi:hypothetical protein